VQPEICSNRLEREILLRALFGIGSVRIEAKTLESQQKDLLGGAESQTVKTIEKEE
jgi:hypothetical protein